MPPIPFGDNELDEIVASHFLEHLNFWEAEAFLLECHRALKMGGVLLIVVPDTAEIMRRWIAGTVDAIEFPHGHFWDIKDLNSVCHLFLYSTIQESPHKWSWCQDTLARILVQTGFGQMREIDRYRDPRLSGGWWYQFGIEARKKMACRVCHRALLPEHGDLCPECAAQIAAEKAKEEQNVKQESRETPEHSKAPDTGESED